MERSLTWITGRPTPADTDGPVARPFSPIDGAWLDRTMIERFEEICGRFPDRVAVDDGQVQLTYAQLRGRAYQLAHRLQAMGAASEKIAAIIPGTALYPIALVACMAIGRPLTPVDVTHPLARRASILAEAQPSLALVASGVDLEPGLLADDVQRLTLSLDEAVDAVSAPTPAAPLADTLMGIAFTSGSTGRAKGLAYRQRDIFLVVADHVNALHINEDDIILSLASLGAGGNLDVLAALLTGGRVRMLDIKSAGMGETLRVLGDDRITLLSMIPLVFRTLFQQTEAKTAFASMRAITTGGDRLFGADLELFRSVLPPGCHVRTTQGSTETGVVFNWFVPPDRRFADQATVPSGHLGTAKDVAVVSDGPDADGVIEGEFLVRGANLAAGAWQDGRLTPGPFVLDPEDPARKIFDTGDIVRLHPDGLFEFVGRRDRQIKILGLRADPAEVEAILRKAPGVGDVAVIPRRTGDNATFIAYVAPLDLRAPPQPADLRQAVQVEAPAHMVPAEFRFLPVIPRLPNFKHDFVALDALDQFNRPAEVSDVAVSAAAADLPPEIAAAVRSAWSAVLGQASYAEGKRFDESGGDSLKGLQILLHLEERLGVKLSFELIEPSVTAQGLTARLASTLAPKLRENDGRPLVFVCHALGGDWPRLAHFRRQLNDRIAFETLDYPGLERPASEFSNFAVMLDAAQARLEALAPTGPVRLCGHSAGGTLAFALAHRLRAKGRDVPFLGILDAAPEVTDPRGRHGFDGDMGAELARMRQHAKEGGLAGLLQDRLMMLLLHLQAFETLRRLVLWRSRGGAHRAAYTRQSLLMYARGRALVSWKARPYAGPVTLFASRDRQDGPLDLGWPAVATDLRIVVIPGDHLVMLDSPNVEVLATEFLKAVQATV